VAQPSRSRTDKSIQTHVTELWELTVRYAKQETVDPVRSLGRFLAFGLAGAVLISVGLLVIALGILRLLQIETRPHLGGNWSWVPYLVTIAFLAGVIGLLATRIGAEQRRAQRARAKLEERG